MAPIAIGGMLAIPSPRDVPGVCYIALERDIRWANPNVRNSQTSRVVSTGLTTESVKFVSLAGIHFRWSAQFAGDHIVGGSKTLGSKVATKPKDAKIGEAKQEKSCAPKMRAKVT